MNLIYAICICVFILSDYVFGTYNGESGDSNNNKLQKLLATGDTNVLRNVRDRGSVDSQANEIESTQSSSSYSEDSARSSASGDSQTSDSYTSQTGDSPTSSGELSRYSSSRAVQSLKGPNKGYLKAPSHVSNGIIYQWRNGIFPYFIDSESYDDIIANRIRVATKVIEKSSCILFKPLDEQQLSEFGYSFVYFSNPKKERDCVHTVMRGSKGQPMLVLGYDCMEERNIVHALMHVLGFRDEVTHPQRDFYVRVLWENIQPKYRSLFTITNQPLHKELIEYDMMSIMHFHDRAYSINGAPTVTPLIPGQLINPSDKLSLLDKLKLRLTFRHECNRRKVANLLQTCKNSIQGAIENKVDETGRGTDKDCIPGSGSGSESNKDNGGSLSESDRSNGGSTSGSDKANSGSLSGSDTTNGGAISGSDKTIGGSLNGSNDDAVQDVLGLKGFKNKEMQ